MLRAETKALGTWTIAALLVFSVVAGMLAAGMGASGHATQAPIGSAGSAHVAAPTTVAPAVAPAPSVYHPAAGNNSSPNITASVNITTVFTGSNDVPVPINWTINVSGAAITSNNVSQSLLVMNGANLIVNQSEPVMAGATNYTANIDYALLSTDNYNGGNLPTTPYTFWVWLTVLNVSNGSVPWMNVSSNNVSATLLIANVGVLFTSAVPLYTALPFNIEFTTTFSGNTPTEVNNLNVSINLELRFIESGCGSLFGLGAPCESIANETLDAAGNGFFNTSGTYTYPVGLSDFTSSSFASGQLPYGEYQVIVWTTFANVNDPGQSPRTVAAAEYTYPVFNLNSVSFLSPLTAHGVTAGNVTISVAYVADYLSAANVSVLPNSGSTVLFTSGIFFAGEYDHYASVNWPSAAPGEYKLVVTILTSAGAAGGNSTFSELFNVTSAGGGVVYIYTNTTTDKGVSFGGLSPGAAAATLLVVGLIIGMIVALLLARTMMGDNKPSGSPQPWSAKPGTNECSICHQTFPTEAELKEHAKQAHGKE